MHVVRAALLLGLLAGSASAGKNAELEPVLVEPGKVVFEDDFERAELGKDYKVAKGEWTVREGALVGQELKADEHAAVATFGPNHRDGIVRFSFQLQGAKTLHLSLNRKGGHLFRVIVTPEGIVLRTDKDKKDPASKSVPLARAKKSFPAGQWHTLQLESFGPTLAVTTDNGVTLKGSHASLGVEKLGYRLVTRGDHLLVDDVRVWTAAD